MCSKTRHRLPPTRWTSPASGAASQLLPAADVGTQLLVVALPSSYSSPTWLQLQQLCVANRRWPFTLPPLWQPLPPTPTDTHGGGDQEGDKCSVFSLRQLTVVRSECEGDSADRCHAGVGTQSGMTSWESSTREVKMVTHAGTVETRPIARSTTNTPLCVVPTHHRGDSCRRRRITTLQTWPPTTEK